MKNDPLSLRTFTETNQFLPNRCVATISHDSSQLTLIKIKYEFGRAESGPVLFLLILNVMCQTFGLIWKLPCYFSL